MERTLPTERVIFAPANVRKGVLFFVPVVSALCVVFSFPPFEYGILAWFGLAPLLFALRQRGGIAAAGPAFLFGALFAIGAFPWALFHIAETNLVRCLLVSVFSLYFIIFGLLYRLISGAMGSWIMVGAPALWVALEYMRANLFFLSWPWNLLGHSQYRYLPVIQIADVTGVYGISFLLVMVNQGVSQVPDFFARRRLPPPPATARASGMHWTASLLTPAVVLGLTFSYGWYRLAAPESREHLRVALVQANVLVRDHMPRADQMQHLRVYERLTMEAASQKPVLIVWPSSSLPAPISSSLLVRSVIRRLTRATGSYLLVGGAGHEKDAPPKEGYEPFSNSEFLIAPSGHLEGQYNKIRLLPFNEYLPLQGIITWPQWITTLSASFVPGEEYTLFQVAGVKFGTPICWENMFPALFSRFVRHGAQFMVGVTDEGFFGSTPTPYLQSLAMYTFRAVENRVAVVRAASTGVSAFISPSGEIVERVGAGYEHGLFVPGILVRDVPLSHKKTFYTVYGDVFVYVVIGMAALSILVSLHTQLWLPSRLGT